MKVAIPCTTWGGWGQQARGQEWWTLWSKVYTMIARGRGWGVTTWGGWGQQARGQEWWTLWSKVYTMMAWGKGGCGGGGGEQKPQGCTTWGGWGQQARGQEWSTSWSKVYTMIAREVGGGDEEGLPPEEGGASSHMAGSGEYYGVRK